MLQHIREPKQKNCQFVSFCLMVMTRTINYFPIQVKFPVLECNAEYALLISSSSQYVLNQVMLFCLHTLLY